MSFKEFVRRNAAYLIMVGCVLVTALIIIFAASAGGGGGNPPDNTQLPDPDEQVDVDPVTFLAPVSNARIGNTYDLETPVSLSVPDKNGNHQWVLFQEMEFIADEGTEVLAVYDGRVISVTYGHVDGPEINIRHDGGFVSTYKYLQKDADVKVGDIVAKGEIIGRIGVCYNMQYHIGAHLCFGLLRDGVAVNPADYLELV
jgi:murein DD-endopeptidase MepM/ murein hydrolase activator NlpD